ncbi:type III secretion system inner membrane ring lipoprotein SctJ [Dokdonella sp. MW10]|uniref:type III secretion system inner membrane ring lipoprotein SctJ n=1 Tax=Dokdonella sp. MW10 TaxID=2992926 RepID=UPI003F80D396
MISTMLRGIGVVLLALSLAACGRTMLYANLDEQQANQVQGALLAAGIDADKRPADNKKGWTVEVSKQDFPLAIQLLQSKGLPGAPFESMGVVFKKEGFVSSPLEERARYLYAIAQELEHTIEQIDGVVRARVHIALPEPDPIGDKGKSASASVVIIENAGAKLRDRETDIKAIVTDAVEGLDNVNKVTVKFFTRAPGEMLSAASTTPPVPTTSLKAVPTAAAVGIPLLLVAGAAFAAWAWRGARRRDPAVVQNDARGRRG